MAEAFTAPAMKPSDSSIPNPPQSVYTPSGRWARTPILVAIICGVASVFLFNQAAIYHARYVGLQDVVDPTPFPFWCGVFFLMFGLAFVVAAYFNGGARLVLSAEALVYVTRTATRTYAWKDALALKQTVIPSKHSLNRLDYLMLADGRNIELSLYDAHWREGELGQQLKQYAPWLFAADAETTAKAWPVQHS